MRVDIFQRMPWCPRKCTKTRNTCHEPCGNSRIKSGRHSKYLESNAHFWSTPSFLRKVRSQKCLWIETLPVFEINNFIMVRKFLKVVILGISIGFPWLLKFQNSCLQYTPVILWLWHFSAIIIDDFLSLTVESKDIKFT